ncbi:retrotransposon protein, putative, ty1-copia subclass [Tanacetum coccineum]
MTNTQTPPHATTVVIPIGGAGLPPQWLNHGEKVPEKSSMVQNFKRCNRMVLLFTTLGLARFLKETVPQVEPPAEGQSSNAQAVQAVEAWKHSDFLCHNYVLNGLIDPLYNVYCKIMPAKDLWVQDLQVLLHDIHAEGMTLSETFQVASIIEKLPPSWVEIQKLLESIAKEMSVEDWLFRPYLLNPILQGKGKDEKKNDKKGKGKSLSPSTKAGNEKQKLPGDLLQLLCAMISEVNLGEGEVILRRWTSEKELKLTNVFFESDKFVLSKNQMYVGRGYAMNGMFKLNVMVVKNEINKMNSSAYLIESSNVGKYCYVYLLKSKDEAIDKFVLYKTEVENQLGKKIKVVRSDRGGEYVPPPHSPTFAKHGLDTVHCTLSPQQNGIAKRKNLCPRKEKEETPYELWMGRKPSYQYLRVWGCLAKVVVPTPKAQKIGPKSVDCIFIGYAKNNTAYRFIVHESKNPDIQKNTIMESRNASFFENIFPCLSKETGSSLDDKVVQDKRQRDDNDLQDERQDQTEEEEVEPRRSKRARNEKSFGPDFVSFMVENEPTSYREAVTSSEGQQWREAIKSEIESILQNHTWELVDLPPGCKALGYKWIFKKKMKADGTVDKYKARLVIQGFRQREGFRLH